MKASTKSIHICLLLSFVFLWSTCSKEEPMTSTEPDITVSEMVPMGDEKYLTLKSDYIFDQEKLPTFELQLPEAALAEIDANPAAEEYVEGMLIFEGDTLSPVGIRYKGSVGGFVGCVSGSDWANPSGHKTCTKLSMKIKINWKGREEKFYGLKKLQFHSQNLDDSKMHERLGYWLFRSMGVPAPRSVHARLIINGEYSGLYALTEQIDGRFTRYNYEEGEGNLYKEIWPLNYQGMPHSEASYLAALKTNEDENPSVALIRNFAQEVAAADPSTIQNVISETMDINEILSYAVVDRMIRHDDGPFHWYCGGNNCTNHNFYWYEEPLKQRLHLVPWDLDNAFENIISNANPVTPIADAWGAVSSNCQPFSYGLFNFQQWSAACDPLTAGWVSFDTEYAELKTSFKNGPFSEASTDALIDTWAEQIRAATIEAKDLHGDAISIGQWESALQKLKNQLQFARNN